MEEGRDAVWQLSPSSIPNDIALKIASLLEGWDVCCLGSCSKFWWQLCSSDALWLQLSNKRWPDLNLRLGSQLQLDDTHPQHHTFSPLPPPQPQGWKGFYISRHRSLARDASTLIKFVKDCTHNESLEVGHYLKAINDLRSMKLGFKDVQLFLLASKHSVLLNLIGLHYSIFFLEISSNDMMETLCTCQVADRQVCVNWFKLGRWLHGFRLPDERRSQKITLAELVTTKGEEVLHVLNRGAVHEVFRVQITSFKSSAARLS